jgi:CheY-like chemotaxis protein
MAAAMQQSSTMQERVTSARLTVLVVEDEAAILELAEEVIALLGHKVLCARNGDEALAMLRREAAVDVLFTDIRMPGMDGWELGRTANLAYPGIKVIYTTGFCDSLPSGDQGHAVTLLRKPWRASDLANLLQRILENQCRA